MGHQLNLSLVYSVCTCGVFFVEVYTNYSWPNTQSSPQCVWVSKHYQECFFLYNFFFDLKFHLSNTCLTWLLEQVAFFTKNLDMVISHDTNIYLFFADISSMIWICLCIYLFILCNLRVWVLHAWEQTFPDDFFNAFSYLKWTVAVACNRKYY